MGSHFKREEETHVFVSLPEASVDHIFETSLEDGKQMGSSDSYTSTGNKKRMQVEAILLG